MQWQPGMLAKLQPLCTADHVDRLGNAVRNNRNGVPKRYNCTVCNFRFSFQTALKCTYDYEHVHFQTIFRAVICTPEPSVIKD